MLQLFVAVQHFFADMAGQLDRDETGATAVEYGVMVGLIAVAIIVAVTALGVQLDRLFDEVVTRLTAIVP